MYFLAARLSIKDRLGTPAQTKVDDPEYVPTRRHPEEVTVQQQQQQPIVAQPLLPISPAKLAGAPAGPREEKVSIAKKTQEMLALKKRQEEKRKEAIKLTANLRKLKQELLDKQLMEMKSLIERAEKNPEQKDTIMLTIKTIQQSIDNLKKDIATNGQTVAPKTKVGFFGFINQV